MAGIIILGVSIITMVDLDTVDIMDTEVTADIMGTEVMVIITGMVMVTVTMVDKVTQNQIQVTMKQLGGELL